MLTPEERSELDELCAHYPTRRAASVSVLKWFQERHGWISDEALHDAAGYLGLPPADLEGLATFYNLLYRKPVGEHVILLCDSAPCWVCGYESIRRHLEQRLAIRMGETTEDGGFTLLPVVCLGDCDHGPTMMVGQRLHRDLDPDKVERILDAYRNGSPPDDEAERVTLPGGDGAIGPSGTGGSGGRPGNTAETGGRDGNDDDPGPTTGEGGDGG